MALSRFKRLLLPLFLGGGFLALVLVSPAYAQAEYFLMPANVYDNDAWSDPSGNASGGFNVSGNHFQMAGDCDFDGGWTYCGAGIAVQRPIGVDAVVGFVVDWDDTTVETQTHARPEAFGYDQSGQGSIFGGNSGCANVAACPSPYTDRWCMTDVDPGDLTHLDCGEEPDIWLSEAVTGTNDSLVLYVVNTNGGTLDILIEVDLWWLVLECPVGQTPDDENICQEDEEPPPPPPFEYPIDPGATCTVSTTVTVTSTNGSTTTSQVSVTVPANLMPNYSFEEVNGGSPANWNLWDDPGEDYWYPATAGPEWGYQPLNGDRHLAGWNEWGGAVNPTQVWDIGTYANLQAGGNYLAGFYGKCLGYNCSTQARLYHNGIFVTGSYPISTTYRVFSDVVTLPAGENIFHLSFSMHGWLPRTLFVDDVFLFPVDESGNIICSEEYYDIPTPDTPDCIEDEYGNCIPTPTGGAGSVCYYCSVPSGQSFFSLGHWIAWLGCLIRNLFSCSLRIWLMNITNAVQGDIKYLSAYVFWIPNNAQRVINWFVSEIVPEVIEFAGVAQVMGYIEAMTGWTTATTQGAVNWIAEQVIPAIRFFTIVYETGTTFWDAIIAFLIIVVGAIQAIVQILLSLIGIVLQLIAGIVTGFNTPPAMIELPGSSPFTESGLAADGANTDKALWLFMVGITLIDQDIVPRFGPLLIGVVAAGAIGLILWTINHWKDSVSF